MILPIHPKTIPRKCVCALFKEQYIYKKAESLLQDLYF